MLDSDDEGDAQDQHGGECCRNTPVRREWAEGQMFPGLDRPVSVGQDSTVQAVRRHFG